MRDKITCGKIYLLNNKLVCANMFASVAAQKLCETIWWKKSYRMFVLSKSILQKVYFFQILQILLKNSSELPECEHLAMLWMLNKLFNLYCKL